MAAVAQILGQSLQHIAQQAGPPPLLKPTMTGLIGRVLPRQFTPLGAGPENPEHAVQHGASLLRRPAAPVGATTRPEERFEDGPLLIREIHAARYDGP